ncbi:MAG: hypothetical protein II567_16590 [Candidatus Riflebacteria bacterium]|nr:hypothetical protein [Candidatus Riflebacteria bacterium]
MKTSKSCIAMVFSTLCNNGFLKFFIFVVLLILTSALTGCKHNGSGSFVVPEEESPVLKLYGNVKLNNIKFPTSLCGNNDYQFRDLSVFSLTVQDDVSITAPISANGEFSFLEMAPRQQIVVFCKNASNPNLSFEWMGASTSGLSGNTNITIDLHSTARSLIARTLRDKYGRRVRPEFIEYEHYKSTFDAITDVIENNADLLENTPLSEIDSIKNAYIAAAEALDKGSSGAYPNDHVFLFYFAGDNDLGVCMENTVKSIAEAGLPDNTQIIIALDTFNSLPLLNKPGGARYRVVGNKLELLNELGDVDSTNPIALEKFIEVSVREYPAKGYSLILSSHGGGWRDREKTLASARAVFMNDTNSLATGTVLNTASGIEIAFNELKASNRKFDMIVFDACNLGCIETAYQFSDMAEYTLFSQALMPAEGMPYAEFFKEVSSRKIENLSAYARAELLCDLFCKKYVNAPNAIDTGISIIDNSAVPELVTACRNYFSAVYANINTNSDLLYNIRTQKTTNDGEIISGDVIQSFSPFKEFVDFKQIIEESYVKMPDAKIECDALRACFNDLIKFSKYSDSLKNANGISITFPEKDIYAEYYNGNLPAYEYFHLKFNTYTEWYKILNSVLTK